VTAVLQPSPSRAAFLVRKYFAEQNLDVSIAMAQEAVARSLGYPNWSTLANSSDVRQAPRTVTERSKREGLVAGAQARRSGANYQPDSRTHYSLQRFSLLLLRCGSVRLSLRSASTRVGSVHEAVADFARGIPYVSKDFGSSEVALTCHPTGNNAPSRLVVLVDDLIRGVPLAANGIRLPSGLELWVVPEEDEPVGGESWQCPAVVKGAGARTSGFATYDSVRDAFTLDEKLREARNVSPNGQALVEIRGRLCEVYADAAHPGEWRSTTAEKRSNAVAEPASHDVSSAVAPSTPRDASRLRDIRLDNLVRLTGSQHAQVQLCRMLDCTFDALLLYSKGTWPIKKSFARDVERVTGLPEGWMDLPGGEIPLSVFSAIETGRPASPPAAGRFNWRGPSK